MQYVNSVNCDPCGTDGVQGICAAGYHIPSDLEWSHYEWCVENDPGYTLSYFQNSTGWRGSIVGQKLKATSSNTPPWNGTNASGFTALPAGGRGNGGGFNYLGSFAYFWSATEYSAATAWSRYLYTGDWQSHRNATYKTSGFSVRCLQN